MKPPSRLFEIIDYMTARTSMLLIIVMLSSCDTFSPTPESRYDPKFVALDSREVEALRRYREARKHDQELRQWARRLAPCIDGEHQCRRDQVADGIDLQSDLVCFDCRLKCEQRLDTDLQPWPPNCREHGNERIDGQRFLRENSPKLPPPARGLRIRVPKASD